MLTVETTKQWLGNFNELVQENAAYLSDLDTPIGDGDHGGNMSRGMGKVMEELNANEFETVQDVLKKVAMTLISSVGGASGPLYGSAFMGMAKTAKETTDKLALITSGLAGIQKRGKAEVGDKTMVDIWAYVKEQLEQGATVTTEDIEKVVEASKDLVAKKGRASYLGERSLGHIDPGTCSSGYLLSELLKA